MPAHPAKLVILEIKPENSHQLLCPCDAVKQLGWVWDLLPIPAEQMFLYIVHMNGMCSLTCGGERRLGCPRY